MFLRQLRWIAAGLAALAVLLAAPAQSRADVQILVEELDGGGLVANSGAAQQYFNGTGGFVSFNFTNGVYFGGGGSVSVVGANNSFNPSYSGSLTPAFDASQNHTLRITVTNDTFSVGPGFTGTLLNDSGAASAGLTNGSTTVTTFSRVYDPSSPGAVPASSSTQPADGATVAGPTAPSTVSINGNGPRTTSPAGSLPSPFAIQQTILISITSTNGGPVSGTFGATGGAQVAANAVPAPGGLALALVGLPLLGLRRVLRKGATA